MAPHSSTLAWKIPWTEEPGRLQSMGSLSMGMTERLLFHFSLSCIGEGNGNPLQYSCLENPMDRGAWWTAIYGVPQSQTQLKWVSSSIAYIYIYTEREVWSLGWEDPLEEEMATHSSIFAWRIPWTEESGGLQSGVTKSWTWLSD